MKIFPTSSIKDLDAYTIEHEPISSIDLMERAASAVAGVLVREWPDRNTPFVVFAGPGNNGGDALAVARMLGLRGYRVEAYLFNTKDELSPDCAANRERLAEAGNVAFQEISTQFAPPALTARHVVVDGLFGSGLNKPLSGGFAAVVRHVNASPAQVVSIDIPSGLMGEDNTYNVRANILNADLTLTFQLPKLAFLFPENAKHVGRWEALDIGLSEKGMAETDTNFYMTEFEDVENLVLPRGKFAHKGLFGHALLVAGSTGMAGASILSARGCLRSGVGLLTVHVPMDNNAIVQAAVPEAKTEVDFCANCFAGVTETDNYQAVAVGPGLGQSPETETALLELIDNCQVPMVVDADALNLLANHRNALHHLPQGSILTPHPKELERIVGRCQNSYERLAKARELAQAFHLHVVLKGAYTAVLCPDGTCHFNTTGTPGMATGGSGDVLAGVLLALLAQGYKAEDAARLGVFVHGVAGELAAKKQGAIGMIAGDIVDYLPMAWRMMQEKR